MTTKYFLYDDTLNTFIVNAKKMTKNRTSNYLISSEKNVFDKNKESYAGKLRSNFGKSKYLIYDNGENVERNKNIGVEQARCELGFIAYNIEGANQNGTRAIVAAIPKLNENHSPVTFRQLKKQDSISYLYGAGCTDELYLFENQAPYWVKDKYCLKFSDRVKKSSIKNFQLIKKDKERKKGEIGEVFFEFGKISSNEFTLSFKYPFSIMNAFSFALSAFDK